MERHSERKQIARAKRIAQEGLLAAETTNTSALPAPGTSSPATLTPGTTIPHNLVPRASTSNDATTSAAAAADDTTLTAPLCNLALDNSTPEFPAPTPAVGNAPTSQRINEISREKIVSDLLEKKIKPTSDNFLASLHLELCQDFGMNPVDSLFSDQLFKKCENFSKEAAKLWRKRRGKEETIFAYNRGVCTNKYIFILEI